MKMPSVANLRDRKMQRSLPPEQTGPAAWYGPDMARRQDEWLTHLTPHDIAELEAVAGRWSASQDAIATMTVQDFPLPTLAPKLLNLRAELIHGRGFGLLRGLPRDR